MAKSKAPKKAGWPSKKTGKSSGPGRDKNPPKQKGGKKG
jgi:hypothetical protein